MENIKKFFKVSKHYINYLMKVGFKELLVNFVEIIVVVIIAGILYLPVGVLRDILYKLFVAIFKGTTLLYNIFDIGFAIIGLVICILFFMYLFVKRFENVEQLRSSREDKLYTNNGDSKKENNIFERDVKEEELDLPKPKEEKRKFN